MCHVWLVSTHPIQDYEVCQAVDVGTALVTEGTKLVLNAFVGGLKSASKTLTVSGTQKITVVQVPAFVNCDL